MKYLIVDSLGSSLEKHRLPRKKKKKIKKDVEIFSLKLKDGLKSFIPRKILNYILP